MGTPACEVNQKLADAQRLHYGRPSLTETTEIKDIWMPPTRARLGLMWLSFLSVSVLELTLCQVDKAL